MAFSLPNPTTPTNGQPGDATPILQNELAIAQAIASFDGSQINAKTVVEAALADVINPRLRGSETLANFVYSGCIWSTVSGLIGTMTGGTIYVNGYRTIVSGIGSNTFAASSDTYVYVDYLGNVSYSAVANSSTSPSATANAILVAIVVTNGSAITSINQGSTAATAPVIASNVITVQDSLGNLIYPTDPSSRIIGYRQITGTFTSGATTDTDVTGLLCPAIVPSGRRIEAYFYTPQTFATVDSNRIDIGIQEDGNDIQRNFNRTWSAANGGNGGVIVSTIHNPTTGLHSYKVRIGTGVGAGFGAVFAASTTPAYIEIRLK